MMASEAGAQGSNDAHPAMDGGGLSDDDETQAILHPNGARPAPRLIGVARREQASGDIELGQMGGFEQQLEDIDLTSPAHRRPGSALLPLYSVWPSQNYFCCGGLLLTGGSGEFCAPNICIWAMILFPSGLYFIFVFPQLVQRGAFALPGATLVVFLVATGLLCATCCTDPGILPRRDVIIASNSAAKLEEALGYDPLGRGCQPCGVPDGLYRQGYRYCRTCKIIRPPRASHCGDCDNCVLRYDHHCPFVNNCVGQRNYAFFLGFITCVMFLAMLVMPSIFTYFSALSDDKSMVGLVSVSYSMRVVWYLIIVFGGFVVVAAIGSALLWVYHAFLVVTNRTTKEYRKSITNLTEEPTLCAPRGPQLFDPWALVDPQVVNGSMNSSSIRCGRHL